MNSLQELTSAIGTLGNICGWADWWLYQRTTKTKTFLCPFLLSVSVSCFPQYIFSCLRNGQNPQLTMVHHSTVSKYQEEQGRMCSQMYKNRSLSRPPPLPVKKVRGCLSLTGQHFFFLSSSQSLPNQPVDFCTLEENAVQRHVDDLHLRQLCLRSLSLNILY